MVVEAAGLAVPLAKVRYDLGDDEQRLAITAQRHLLDSALLLRNNSTFRNVVYLLLIHRSMCTHHPILVDNNAINESLLEFWHFRDHFWKEIGN